MNTGDRELKFFPTLGIVISKTQAETNPEREEEMQRVAQAVQGSVQRQPRAFVRNPSQQQEAAPEQQQQQQRRPRQQQRRPRQQERAQAQDNDQCDFNETNIRNYLTRDQRCACCPEGHIRDN